MKQLDIDVSPPASIISLMLGMLLTCSKSMHRVAFACKTSQILIIFQSDLWKKLHVNSNFYFYGVVIVFLYLPSNIVYCGEVSKSYL